MGLCPRNYLSRCSCQLLYNSGHASQTFPNINDNITRNVYTDPLVPSWSPMKIDSIANLTGIPIRLCASLEFQETSVVCPAPSWASRPCRSHVGLDSLYQFLPCHLAASFKISLFAPCENAVMTMYAWAGTYHSQPPSQFCLSPSLGF